MLWKSKTLSLKYSQLCFVRCSIMLSKSGHYLWWTSEILDVGCVVARCLDTTSEVRITKALGVCVTSRTDMQCSPLCSVLQVLMNLHIRSVCSKVGCVRIAQQWHIQYSSAWWAKMLCFFLVQTHFHQYLYAPCVQRASEHCLLLKHRANVAIGSPVSEMSTCTAAKYSSQRYIVWDLPNVQIVHWTLGSNTSATTMIIAQAGC